MAGRILKADILDAAAALLDDGGLPALAMRRIATRLGVQQSALYWHFDNKQQLLGALADHLLAGLPAPGGRDWPGRITTLSERLRDRLLAHRDGAELVATAYAFGLGGDAPRQAYLRELTGAGLPHDDAQIATSVLVHYVLGHVTSEQQQHQAAELGAIDPAIARDGNGASCGTTTDGSTFRDGIDLILGGIRAKLTSVRRDP